MNEFENLISEIATTLIDYEKNKQKSNTVNEKSNKKKEKKCDQIYEDEMRRIVNYCKGCLIDEINKQLNKKQICNNIRCTGRCGGCGYGYDDSRIICYYTHGLTRE